MLILKHEVFRAWKKLLEILCKCRGGGGRVVSMPAFYSDDPSSNPADLYSFSLKFVFEKKENKQKDAGVGPFWIYKFQLPIVIYLPPFLLEWRTNIPKHSFMNAGTFSNHFAFAAALQTWLTKNGVKWLWRSWQSGRLQYQRTRVRIQPLATFIEHLFTVSCFRKDENKEKKRPRMAHLKKKFSY